MSVKRKFCVKTILNVENCDLRKAGSTCITSVMLFNVMSYDYLTYIIFIPPSVCVCVLEGEKGLCAVPQLEDKGFSGLWIWDLFVSLELITHVWFTVHFV